MKVLGIDPGTVVVGYGVIESKDSKITLIDCGSLTTKARSPIGERLSYLYNKLCQVVLRYQPDAVAVEQPSGV